MMGKKKKKAFISLFLMASFINLPINGAVKAAENENIILGTIQPRQEIDHKTDKKKAEEWAKEKYKNWEREVNTFQKEAISNVLEEKQEMQNAEQLNHHLQYFGGNFDIVKPGSAMDFFKEGYVADMSLMDGVFRMNEGKTHENLYVYKNVSLANILNAEFKDDLFEFDQSLKSSFTNINREVFQQMREGLEYGTFSSYVVSDIAEETGGNDRLKFRIRVPAGTPSAYDGKNRLIFDKNQGLIIKDMSIIVQNGKEYIRINADLVDKSVIDQKVKSYAEDTKKLINDRFQLGSNYESATFDFRGIGGSLSVESIKPELEKAFNLIDAEFADHLFNDMLEVKGGKFIFTDLPIWALLAGKDIPMNEADVILGVTDATNGEIYLRVPYSLTDLSHSTNLMQLDGVILHELGHMADRFFNISPLPMGISSSKEYRDIFEKERNNLTAYAASSIGEFFAEAFRIYHLSKEELKEKAPEAYKFLEDQIEKTINA